MVLVWNIQTLYSTPRTALFTDAAGIQRWLPFNLLVGLFSSEGEVVSCEITLAVLELIILSYYLVRVAVLTFKIAVSIGADRWCSVSVLFWDVLPEISTVSALKTLHY